MGDNREAVASNTAEIITIVVASKDGEGMALLPDTLGG
jgi:hypothetical protein